MERKREQSHEFGKMCSKKYSLTSSFRFDIFNGEVFFKKKNFKFKTETAAHLPAIAI